MTIEDVETGSPQGVDSFMTIIVLKRKKERGVIKENKTRSHTMMEGEMTTESR